MGTWIAERLNRCEGEVRFAIPMGGFLPWTTLAGISGIQKQIGLFSMRLRQHLSKRRTVN